jgi:hypothetical protein
VFFEDPEMAAKAFAAFDKDDSGEVDMRKVKVKEGSCDAACTSHIHMSTRHRAL